MGLVGAGPFAFVGIEMEKLGDVIVRVLVGSWNARAATIKATRQEEKTPLKTKGSDERRAQIARKDGEDVQDGRRVRKVEG